MKINYKFLIFFLSLLSIGCREEEFDEYYGHPESLEDPIYQQLEARGNFNYLLTAIDQAGYKDILGESGYWTMFAPNDAAFEKFFAENPDVNSESDLDPVISGKIVKYALVYNAFRTDHIADFQASTGWEPDMAFKRRTAYYDGFYKEMVDGREMVVVASNRNNTISSDYYVPGDNNNKHIPYFFEDYMELQALSPFDYNYFYPDQPYTGFNVIDGEVLTEDIVAENGVIHEVSEVSLPLPNFDQYISANSEYSLFESILEDNLVEYVEDEEATRTYRTSTGNSEEVYVKVYDAELAFSPNNENFLKEMDNDAQADGYTMFVPTNNALQDFIDEVLLKHYPTLESLPKYVFVDFFNAHMWQTTVWPSKYSNSVNFLEEAARFDNAADVVDKQVLSNGLFYGTNTIQKSNIFYSVYTSAYLDPEYTLMTMALNDPDGYENIISNINRNFTIFMMSDDVLRDLGYDYDIDRSEWTYTSPVTGNTVTGSLAKSRILRILYNHIASTPNGELDDLSGSGIFRSGDSDIPGEYIRYENNTVFAAGNEVLGNVVNILGYEDQPNGRVYYTDNVLEFSEEAQGLDIMELAQQTDSPFSSFYNYLENSVLYDPAAGSIRGVQLGTSYTFLVPDNDAIQQAVEDGVLPGTDSGGGVMVPNFSPNTLSEQDMVTKFIQYHILDTKTVAADGFVSGLVGTLLQDEMGETVYLKVINDPGGNLYFEDSAFRTANIISQHSNNLADRSLIHLIDNYLLYNE